MAALHFSLLECGCCGSMICGSKRNNLMHKINPSDVVEPRILESIHGEHVRIPHPTRLTHLQFRRFAGCPMCNLHIQSFIARHDELVARGIEEVAVFHSSQRAMKKYHASAPFCLIADPMKSLYRAFGVDTSIWSVLHPKAWPAALKGVFSQGVGLPSRDESPFGLPADFLIDSGGRVLAAKYGEHAYDQWSVDELLALAQEFCASDLPGCST